LQIYKLTIKSTFDILLVMHQIRLFIYNLTDILYMLTMQILSMKKLLKNCLYKKAWLHYVLIIN